jgi:hypothetical protein
MNDLENKSIAELLSIHVSAINELRDRNVLRTENTPTGDLAEYLFCKAFGWAQESNSAKAYDAVDVKTRQKYQIKGRRVHRRNRSRQLSAIRDLDGFDYVAGVIFDDYYQITRAALIPKLFVKDNSRFSKHTNSNIFHLRESVWDDPSVTDVTEKLRVAYAI